MLGKAFLIREICLTKNGLVWVIYKLVPHFNDYIRMKTRMTKGIFFLLTILLPLTNLFGQDFQTHLKENAVKIEHLDKLDTLVYGKLKDFKLIMIGEMHGTNEPAKLLTGLTEMFTMYGDTIQVGFEIPSELMNVDCGQLSDSCVFKSDFFLKRLQDGRASVAWANALTRLSKNSKVQIFFFDINKTESIDFQDRDSLMYLKIKQKIINHPNRRTITLCGNIHNMRDKYREKPTTAYFLCNDKNLILNKKICTLTHYYQSGTMLNNIGNGLELRQVEDDTSVFSETFDYDNYLYLYPIENIYNGIFFTKTVTAAKLTSIK